MDEIAYKLQIDPLDLRRRNETLLETISNKPYTSRSLLQCIARGAELFGWSKRNPQPSSMATADDLIGYGYNTAFYPTQVGPAECRVSLTPSLRAIVEVGTHEIGTGICTVVAMTVSDLLGIPLASVEVRTGDSRLPAAPMSAGSNSTASVCTVVAMACHAIRKRIALAAIKTAPARSRVTLKSLCGWSKAQQSPARLRSPWKSRSNVPAAARSLSRTPATILMAHHRLLVPLLFNAASPSSWAAET